MTKSLIEHYTEAGIIQFGRFEQPDGSFAPVSLNFLLLPSFPALMQATAKALLPLLQSIHADRLLSTLDAIPLGAVLSVESAIPLTYPHGEAKTYTSAFVIEGAYDVGHPTALLTYTLVDSSDAQSIMQSARKVGLNVRDVLCLFSIGERGIQELATENVRVHALFDFADALDILQAQGILPSTFRNYLHTWLQT
ncbi:MAG TPA: hypothetical protein VJZ27_11095 [Aggregatilineales bacterium]|nr:hypothetical protein [Aggregatilineales bacterium]